MHLFIEIRFQKLQISVLDATCKMDSAPIQVGKYRYWDMSVEHKEMDTNVFIFLSFIEITLPS